MTARPMSRGAGPPWSRVDGLFAKPVANFVRHPADSKAAQAVRENFLRFADEGGCLYQCLGVQRGHSASIALRDKALHAAAAAVTLPPRQTLRGRPQSDLDRRVASLMKAVAVFLDQRWQSWTANGVPANAQEIDRHLFDAARQGRGIPQTRQGLRRVLGQR